MTAPRIPASNLPREARAWATWMEKFAVAQLRRNEREDTSGLNAAKARESTSWRQGLVIQAIPFQVNGYDSQNGFGLVEGWNPVASVTIAHPSGWDRVNFTAIGGAAVLDDITGGLTACQARIRIGDSISPVFAPAKDAGASKVNNILNPQHGLNDQDATLSTTTTCVLELSPLNPNAFPAAISNYSSLVIQALFTNPTA